MKSVNPVAILANRAVARRDRHELAFLPAALEILETPPSPVGRAVMLTVCGLLLLAVVWSGFTYIDTTSTAPGKIVPSGKSKSVQPFSTGVVRAIYVDDGTRVTAGQVLVELDPTMSDADTRRARNDYNSTRIDVARQRAALLAADGADPREAFQLPKDTPPGVIATQLQLLISQTNEFRAKISVLDKQIIQKQSDRASVASTIAKDQSLIPILKQQVDMRKTLFDQNYGSKLNYLEILQQLTGLEQDLAIQKDNLRTADAALQGVMEQRNQTAAEYKRTLSDALATGEAKATSLEQDLVKAEELGKRQVLTASVDGIVQQLAIHTVGGVVTPAQTLMVVVPTDSHLEIEAMVSNSDIGFVRPGQDAQVKIGTFDFTRYGLIPGKVLNVSADAVSPQQLAAAPGQQQGSSDPGQPSQVASSMSNTPPQGAVYAARISVSRNYMNVEGNRVNLSPGMAVTAEIKTGSRTILGYLLSSVRRATDDAMHER